MVTIMFYNYVDILYSHVISFASVIWVIVQINNDCKLGVSKETM